MEEDGDVYVLVGPDEDVKEFVEFDDTRHLDASVRNNLRSGLQTLYVGGGKREKVSRGDILGFLVKEGGIEASQIGKISVYDHYALVAVEADVANKLLNAISGKKLKGEKRRITSLK